MENRPQTTDQATDQSPRNLAKVQKQQNIYLFSIALTILHQTLPSPAVEVHCVYTFAFENRGVCVCVCVCVRAGGGGGGDLLISVAEVRYRYDLVRQCHKFYFCPFQMKIPHIDEEKELYALPIQGSV